MRNGTGVMTPAELSDEALVGLMAGEDKRAVKLLYMRQS